MAMQINGNYDRSGADYTERIKEKQAAEKAEKTKEAEKTAEEKGSGRLSELRDEYVSSEKAGKGPAGLYRVGRDEKEICVGNTDRIDREIRELKEKKQQLEQEIRSASGDEKKIRELEKKLAQADQELSRKDNDTYRKQNTVFSRI